VDDDAETADEGAAVEPDGIAAKSADERPRGSKSSSGPSFGRQTAGADENDAAEEPPESVPSESSEKELPSPGWKNQRSKPLPATDAPAAVAQKSRPVETVIYAAPDGVAPAADEGAAGTEDESKPSRLLLEIDGPRAARIGQTCNFEIRVKNPGRTKAERITLSVELPAELVHEVAQSLEQKVATISPGETYRALVRTRAKSTGKATVKADAAIDDQADAKASAMIDISPGASAGRAPRR
jgi:hypothetical protein